MLATPQWLIAHHRDANVRVIDPRQPTDYDKGHVPGAVNANTPFKDPDRPLHVMTPAQAEAAIRALGISGDTTDSPTCASSTVVSRRTAPPAAS